jgi:hypothetical protein
MIQLVMADNFEQITAQYIPSQETRVTGEKAAPPQISSLFFGSNPILYWEPNMIDILFTLSVKHYKLIRDIALQVVCPSNGG